MIIGTGIDIVNVQRLRALMAKAGEKFLLRWFTDEEVAYCSAKAQPAVHLAGRLAAKEALIKAMRPAWEGPVMLREIAVVSDGSGAPSLRLSARAAEIAKQAGIITLHVSIAHEREYAVASVIATGR